MKRIYNTSEDKAFMFVHNSKEYIHQPKKGRWELVSIKEYAPKHPDSEIYARRVRKLECVDPDATPRNWLDVPEDYAMSLESPEKRLVHHDFLKPQELMDIEMESALAEKEREIAAKEAELAALEAKLSAAQDASFEGKVGEAVDKIKSLKPAQKKK